jgi:hypothetical protein
MFLILYVLTYCKITSLFFAFESNENLFNVHFFKCLLVPLKKIGFLESTDQELDYRMWCWKYETFQIISDMDFSEKLVK